MKPRRGNSTNEGENWKSQKKYTAIYANLRKLPLIKTQANENLGTDLTALLMGSVGAVFQKIYQFSKAQAQENN